MNLNDQQRAAVESTGKVTIVVAGPGAGKTRVAQHRIEAGDGAIIALSYTNNGANELRARLGDKRLEYCGTLHGYCFRLLQRFGRLLGFRAGIAILPESEKLPRLKAVRDRLGKKKVTDAMLKTFQWKGEGVWHDGSVADTMLVFSEYEFELKRSNMVDFDMILRDGYQLLQNDGARCKLGVAEVVADEGQDFSELDWSIFFSIPARRYFVVGDPDQSVFAWRGAAPLAFLALAQREDTTVVVLDKNYRSDRAICLAATHLITHNVERVSKSVSPVAEAEGDIVQRNFDDAFEEMELVVAAIHKELRADKTVAVLCRTNWLAKQFQAHCRLNDVALEGRTFERPPDWDRALTLVGLGVAPDNEILIERYLRQSRGHDYAMAWMREFRLGGRSIGAELEFTTSNIRHVADALARDGISSDTVAIVAERVTALLPDGDVSDLLHDLHAIDEWRPATESRGVYVGTIHGAKGREWDTVFIPALEEGVLPMTKESSNIEEERRLCFVAVTRARHRLVMTSSALRKLNQFAPPAPMHPSRFLGEMGL